MSVCAQNCCEEHKQIRTQCQPIYVDWYFFIIYFSPFQAWIEFYICMSHVIRSKKFFYIDLYIVKNCKGMGICLQGASQESLFREMVSQLLYLLPVLSSNIIQGTTAEGMECVHLFLNFHWFLCLSRLQSSTLNQRTTELVRTFASRWSTELGAHACFLSFLWDKENLV